MPQARRAGRWNPGCHVRNTAPMRDAPRCGARTRAGTPCRAPKVAGRPRCRLHGGAPGSGGQRDNANALKHGYHTWQKRAWRAAMRRIMRDARHAMALYAHCRKHGIREVALPVDYWDRAFLFLMGSVVAMDLPPPKRIDTPVSSWHSFPGPIAADRTPVLDPPNRCSRPDTLGPLPLAVAHGSREQVPGRRWWGSKPTVHGPVFRNSPIWRGNRTVERGRRRMVRGPPRLACDERRVIR